MHNPVSNASTTCCAMQLHASKDASPVAHGVVMPKTLVHDKKLHHALAYDRAYSH